MGQTVETQGGIVLPRYPPHDPEVWGRIGEKEMFTTSAERRSFTTADGVRLSYLEAGEGRPMLLLHGWSQAALMWHGQIEAFRQTHRVIALDMRGHGGSDKPEHGYRIARLVQDLAEFMTALDLEDVVLVAHSLGCSVALGYLDLFGPSRIGRLVLFDESAALCDNPTLTPDEREAAGATLPAEGWFAAAAELMGPGGEAMTGRMLRAMFTPQADPATVDAVIALNLAFPRRHAARLLISNVFQDWRDLYRRITVPTLVMGAEASVVPAASMAWQAGEIADATLVIIAAGEGGSHFAFLENPAAFNAAITRFLGG